MGAVNPAPKGVPKQPATGVPPEETVEEIIPLATLGAGETPQQVIGIVGANVINTMLYIAGGLTILYMIYTGGLFISAQGDSGKVETAKRKLINSIAGIGVITISLFIVRLIRSAISPI